MRLRLAVAAIAVLLMAFGFMQLRKMPVDALPEFSRPQVEIQIEALGLSAQEVEAMITTPLEADMLNGCPWAEEIRSVSLPGLASITLIFEQGTDIMRARQVTSERLTEVFALPNVSKQFTMINPVSSTGRCMEIGLTSETLSLIEMSVLARWTIVPHLMGLPGVANVSIWGERQRQLQVQVDQERLRAEGLTLMQIINTAGNSLWASPLSFLEASTPGTGGWIDTPNQRLGIRHVLPIKTAKDLAKVPIEGAPSKRLGDVTTVMEDHQPLIGDAIVNDRPSLMLVVERFPWANTMDVTREVEKALGDLRPGLAGLEMDPTLFRPATFLEMSARHLSLAVLIGAVLVILALFAFLFNWRMALIGTTTALMSVIAAGTVLYLGGVTLNMMIIAGLVIAIGAIIDSVIADMEHIGYRLRQAEEEGGGKPTAATIYRAVVETHSWIFYATVILLVALMPVLFLEGVSGAFWRPVAIAYGLALLASLVAALTITPALSLLFLGNGAPRVGDSPVAGMLRGVHGRAFGWAARAPRLAFAVVAGLLVLGLLSIPFLRQESLLPNFKETDLVVRLEGSPSASHAAMARITTLANRELRAIPGVRNVSAHLGRAIMSDRHTNINAGELWVSIDPAADYDASVAAVQDVVAGYPGLNREVLTHLQAAVRDELTGTGEGLVVRVYGEDMNVIRQKSEEVARVLQGIVGIDQTTVHYPQELPTLELEVDIERARHYGLKPGDVRRAATSMVAGITVGSLFEEQKVFDVIVWGTPDIRHSVDAVENLLITTPAGGEARLKDVAHVRIVPSATEIHRDAVARRMDVSATVRGRDLVAVAADIDHALDRMTFPLEYRAELLGEYAERLDAHERVLAFAVAAAIGIFLLLQAFVRSWRLATAIFLTLPVALVGGVLAALLSGGGLLSFGSILGFVTVLGIAVRNGIALIARYRRLEQENGDNFSSPLIQQATSEQSPAILMTAVTTALLFAPFIVLGNVAGLEILHPLAIVALGGLVTATVSSLVAVPALYVLFGAQREPELELEDAVAEGRLREAVGSVGGVATQMPD